MANFVTLVKGKVNLPVGGPYSLGPNGIVHCEVAGTVTIHWADGTTTDYGMTAGQTVVVTGATGVTTSVLGAIFTLG